MTPPFARPSTGCAQSRNRAAWPSSSMTAPTSPAPPAATAPMSGKRIWTLSLGVTCHASRDLALTAGEAGADYVAFGAFFPSPTKDAQLGADPALLSWWAEMIELPSVAIGGITAENCAPLVRAGADFLAVSSAVWNHPEGEAAGVRAMLAAIQAAEAAPPPG